MKLKVAIIAIFCLIITNVIAQIPTDTMSFDELVKYQMESVVNMVEFQNRRVTASALPGMGYSPESAWEFGFVAGISIKPQDSTSIYYRPSNISTYFSYSTNNWFLTRLKSEIYTNRGFKYALIGRFMNSPNTFYGIGNDNIPDTTSKFTFRNIELNLKIGKNIGKRFFIGTEIDLFDAQNLSIKGDILNQTIIGYDGGTSLGIGAFASFDTRDNINYPYHGIYCNIGSTFYPDYLPNNYIFKRYTLQISAFQQIISDLIFCFDTRISLSDGEIPFYKMPQLAGNEYLRGISNRYKYIDKNCAYSQIELRKYLWWRLGGAIFGGIGNTFCNIHDNIMDSPKWIGGLGIRFAIAQEERLNFRIDLGFGSNHDKGIYMSLKEAF